MPMKVNVGLPGRHHMGGVGVQDSDSRQVKAVRQLVIVLGERYPENGELERQRWTRWVADRGRYGNTRNEKPVNLKLRRRGADPPRNESASWALEFPRDSIWCGPEVF